MKKITYILHALFVAFVLTAGATHAAEKSNNLGNSQSSAKASLSGPTHDDDNGSGSGDDN